MRIALIFLSFLIAGWLTPAPAQAQLAGTLAYSTSLHTLQFYDGSAQKVIGLGTTVTTCAPASEGFFSYDSTGLIYTFCNGTNTIDFTTYLSAATCTSAGQLEYEAATRGYRYCNGTNWAYATQNHGYFVMTSGTYPGNLGGLAGANSLCVTNLQANNWKGKTEALARGIVAAPNIQAFLCDGATCQTPNASTLYFYATAGDLTAGGSKLVIDSGGIGPNDGFNWSAASYFNSIANVWTGRALGTTNAWPLTSDATTCTGFTTSSSGVTGGRGGTNTGSSGRWKGSVNACNNSYRLYCFVNP